MLFGDPGRQAQDVVEMQLWALRVAAQDDLIPDEQQTFRAESSLY